MQRSPSCVTAWVDYACAAINIRLADLDRRQLIAALLSRQHLILSGPAGIGKCRLAYALALSIADGRESHVCLLQGHPWWASRTGDLVYFVSLQTRFSEWRLAYFIESVLHSQQPPAQVKAEGDTGDYVACVQRMSPVEIDFYFRGVSQSLRKIAPGKAEAGSIRLIETYDRHTPPDLDHGILSVAAVVHLSSTPVEHPV